MLVLLMFKYRKITRYILIPLVWRYYKSVTMCNLTLTLSLYYINELNVNYLEPRRLIVSINSVSLYQIYIYTYIYILHLKPVHDTGVITSRST